MALIEDLASAIATFEGYFKGGTIAARNNNPGNLRTWGSRPIVDGYAYFDTVDEGWAALRHQISLDISRGHTLTSFLNKYAPPSDNNPTESYISFVASRAKIPTDVPLSQLQGGEPPGPPSLGPVGQARRAGPGRAKRAVEKPGDKTSG